MLDILAFQVMAVSDEFRDAKESLKGASDRARAVVYTLLLTCIVLGATIFNERQNWWEAKNAKLRSSLMYLRTQFPDLSVSDNEAKSYRDATQSHAGALKENSGRVRWIPTGTPAVKVPGAINPDQRSSPTYSLSVDALVKSEPIPLTEKGTDSWDQGKEFLQKFYGFIDLTDPYQRKLLNELLTLQIHETETRRSNAQVFSLPFLPLNLSVSDIGLISSLLIVGLMLLLSAMIRRMIWCLSWAAEKCIADDDSPHAYNMLVSDQVLYDPEGLEDKNARHKSAVVTFLPVVPFAVMAWVTIRDYIDLQDQQMFDAGRANLVVVVDTISLLVVLGLMLSHVIQMNQIHQRWRDLVSDVRQKRQGIGSKPVTSGRNPSHS